MSQSCLFLDSLLLLGKIGAQETWELMRHSLRTFIEVFFCFLFFFFFRLSRSLSWWRKKRDIRADAPGNSSGLLALLRRRFWSQVCSVAGIRERVGVHRERWLDSLLTVTWALPAGYLGAVCVKGSLLPSSPCTWIISKAAPRPSGRGSSLWSLQLPKLLSQFLLSPPSPGSNNPVHTEMKRFCEPTPT